MKSELTAARAYSSFNLFGAVLAALMLACLVMVLSGLLQRFVPAWQPAPLVGACFLVALEAAIVHYTVRRERMWLVEVSSYLVAEIAVLLLLMRIVATLSQGLSSLPADLQLWLRSPLAALDVPFLSCTLVGLVVGIIARNTAHDLHELSPRHFDQLPSRDSEQRMLLIHANSERGLLLQRLAARFVWGGVIMLLAMAGQVVNIQRIDGPALALPPTAAVAGVFYLIAGFVLYSQARLALLRARWWQEGALVEPKVLRSWHRASLLLIGLIALGALLLPRSYGLGLLDTIRLAFAGVLGFTQLLFFGISYVVLALIALLSVIPALLLSWLGLGQAPPLPPLTPVPATPPPPPLDGLPGTPPLLPSLIFWTCMLMLGGYALWTVLQRHPAVRHLVAQLQHGLLARLLLRLRQFWAGVQAASLRASHAVAERMRRNAPRPTPRWPTLRLNKLAPRDLVRYFYRSTLQRALLRGIGRRRAQTPYEYRETLAKHFPDASDDIDSLTEAFVAAEYSQRPTTRAESKQAQRPWARLRRRLRQEPKR